MDNTVSTPLNPRAVMGGNHPPVPNERNKHEDRARELKAAGSAWLNEVKAVEDQAQADAAAAFIRQCADFQKQAEEARKKEKQPHLDAGREIDEFWKLTASAVVTARTAVERLLAPYLQRLRDEQARAAAAAAAAAREAELAAERKRREAEDLQRAAQAGELAGTGTNTIDVIEQAEMATAAAKEAARAAQEAASAKAHAGGQFSVNGSSKAVGLRSRTVVTLDLPDGAPTKVTIEALKKLVPFIVKHGYGDDLREQMGRIVNAIYREDKEVAPGCKETIIEKVQ